MRKLSPALALLALCSFASCASKPSSPLPAEPKVALRRVPEAELIERFGAVQARNPFLAPNSLLTGRPNDFVVLELALELPAATRVEVDAELLDASGGSFARLYDLQEMIDYFNNFQLEMADVRSAQSMLKRYYVPGLAYNATAGKKRYFFVLVGKHPLPDGCRVHATAFAGGAVAAEFDEDLPPAPKPVKKKR